MDVVIVTAPTHRTLLGDMRSTLMTRIHALAER